MAHLQEALHNPNSGMSRRALLRTGATTGLGLAALGLVGCGESDGNPQDLLQKLLTTPFKNGELPPTISSTGISTGTLDETAKILGAMGQVNISIRNSDPRLSGTGRISYTAFPNSSGPRRATESVMVNVPSYTKQGASDLDEPVFEFSYQGSVVFATTTLDNIFIALFSPGQILPINLARVAINHLKSVR